MTLKRIISVETVANPEYRWWNSQPATIQKRSYLKVVDGYVVAERIQDIKT